MKLFLEGVCNRLDSVWIELQWFFYTLSPFRKRIGMQLNIFECCEIIPKVMLIRYESMYTHNTYRYAFIDSKVTRVEGWNRTPIWDWTDVNGDIVAMIYKAHSDIFNSELEETLDIDDKV